MTYLKKPVRRSTPAKYRGRNLVIQIEPLVLPQHNISTAIIKVKEKGRRLWHEITLDEIFWIAGKKYAKEQAKKKKEERKKKK